MLDTFKTLIIHQFEAALCTLNACIDRCPESAWEEKVGSYKFCQVVFHTLIFADLYLGADEQSIKRQAFHVENGDFFGDYEEFEDRPPVRVYRKGAIRVYVEHCRKKAGEVLAAETEQSLQGPSGFSWLKFARAEVHVYNIRHIQHHAAQLSLRLRIDGGEAAPWVRSGWKEI